MLKTLSNRKYFKTILFILCSNTIGISLYYSFYSANLYYKENDINYNSALLQTSFTETETSQKLKSLLSKFKSPTVTSEITISSDYFETDQIVQDPRVIFSLTLNWLYHQIKVDPENVSFPFNWADWVDLTYLNHQLSKPQNKRIKCQDLIQHLQIRRDEHKRSARKNPMFFGCKNTHELTKLEIEEMGLANLDKLPGFFQFEATEIRSSEFIRVLQGKTYILGRMPPPVQVMFLNDDGDDLLFQVDKKMKGKELLQLYITNNKLNDIEEITLDTVTEFKQLRDLLGVNSTQNHYIPEKIVQMDPSWFHYNAYNVSTEIKTLNSQDQLTPIEQRYLNSLIASKRTSGTTSQREPTYFKIATLTRTPKNQDSGWHYDWRFINGKWRDRYRHSIILERLLRNWFKFCQKYGIISWINYGSLLGWYRNGAIYPFDLDIDIQMSIYHMTILGKKFNQTLVVEDLREGTGKYLIDVGTFIHNRYITKNANHIDARFLDVDSGLYIDLTALAISKESSKIDPKFFKDICDDPAEGPVLDNDDDKEIYNDRNNWMYKFSHLSPLRLTMFEGIPCYVPKQIVKRMKFQYPCGTLNNFEFDHWYYVEQAGTWIHEKELLPVLDTGKAMKDRKLNKNNVKKQLDNLTDVQLYLLLCNDQATLANYQLAQRYFGFHIEESKFLFTIDPNLNKNKNDLLQGKVLDASPEDNPEYLKLVESNVWLRTPHRESLAEYEKVNGKLSDYNELAFSQLEQVVVSKNN
ncbi:uncharacterized protein SPAPADRAFT_147474 [Spathaspora passalidarum NRRL Y-27907]|uniref:LicD/FKTN/FKRP nucleotidyltransferase domain-containing protein n=1 Tax=Spathaspora passalidarum (strain NRRL Y-27907 / 11-Y1) TaxID=619300 RepID=G3AEX5_SPAPN|nr:uncharacterized protein SPAPADRAFT_147474 [Spathaspora passalidarum NRRL Y-27907]EGW35805.1 hypothetical protein SPAPADRAFT_147474 [Spathaspora passalidarum NRRL Y-27907]